VTKRQKQTRIRQVEKELLALLKERFPLVELLGSQEWADGRVVFDVYAPYEDELEVMQTVVRRLVELSINEGLHVSVFPLKEKPAHRAA
jgi:hypothetical protein